MVFLQTFTLNIFLQACFYTQELIKSLLLLLLLVSLALGEKCPNTKFFLVRIQENTDQKKLRIWTLFTQSKNKNRENFGSHESK